MKISTRPTYSDPSDFVGRVCQDPDTLQFFLIVDDGGVYHLVDLETGVVHQRSRDSVAWLLALINNPAIEWWDRIELSQS